MALYYNNCITVTVEFYNRLYNGRGDENKKGNNLPQRIGLITQENGRRANPVVLCIPYKARKV